MSGKTGPEIVVETIKPSDARTAVLNPVEELKRLGGLQYGNLVQDPTLNEVKDIAQKALAGAVDAVDAVSQNNPELEKDVMETLASLANRVSVQRKSQAGEFKPERPIGVDMRPKAWAVGEDGYVDLGIKEEAPVVQEKAPEDEYDLDRADAPPLDASKTRDEVIQDLTLAVSEQIDRWAEKTGLPLEQLKIRLTSSSKAPFTDPKSGEIMVGMGKTFDAVLDRLEMLDYVAAEAAGAVADKAMGGLVEQELELRADQIGKFGEELAPEHAADFRSAVRDQFRLICHGGFGANLAVAYGIMADPEKPTKRISEFAHSACQVFRAQMRDAA